ncbi:DUF927 domain-containing protein [Crenobacter cavernae]|uniref:DUF927 domain-containing protein n=1 Tax=Crenobacter cavernae TaxID=2290923 RepID=A0A345Y5X0_9NEIS|nr:DUF927 domain-containing protein [Crenobacter cavernae]AXK39322.1 DUF927 domain-containing protein [Crenobacter cavernae]
MGLAATTQRGLQDKLAKYHLQEEGSDAMHHVTARGLLDAWRVHPAERRHPGHTERADFLPGRHQGRERLRAARHARRLARPRGAAGASVWGHHEQTKLAWDATALGLANAAAARNDCLMFLDEAGQGSPDAVSLLAYRLFNGTGKMQGAKDGGNREQARWRVLAFSTGEHPVGELLKEGGRRIKVGQSVRLPSIAADAGRDYGVFETLHGYPSAKALADDLKRLCGEHYGTAGRAFVEYVAPRREELADLIREHTGAWCADLPPSSGQAARVVTRFAVVALALELATRAGITGWAEGEAREAIHALMREWLQRNGTGKHEDRAIVDQAEVFLALHGFSRSSNSVSHWFLLQVYSRW